MIDQNEDVLKVIISRHQQGIFALALYLIGGDKDKAYDITVASFVKVICTFSLLERRDLFLARLAETAVEECRNIKSIPSSDEFDLKDFSSEEREPLRIVKTALQLLPFDMKALLLLRDQLHFSYKDVSTVLNISEHDAKIQTTQARSKLRKKITDIMNHER